MSLPINKYLNLSNGNEATQHVLQKFVVDGNQPLFYTMSSSILGISNDEAIKLYSQIQLMIGSHSIISADNTSSSFSAVTTTTNSSSSTIANSAAMTIANSMEPSIETDFITIQSPKQKNSFGSILKADAFMASKVNSNEFKQHSSLEAVYKIPKIMPNVQQITLDKITAIKQMQIQYDEKRLIEIPPSKLKSEHVLRTNLIQCSREIKKHWNHIKESMTTEINTDKLLKECMKKTQKNRQKARNVENCQYELQQILNDVQPLRDNINQTIISIDEYVQQRQLIYKVDNGEYFGILNPWRRKMTDEKVTNYFISDLNKLKSVNDEISTTTTDFQLHIQSVKYSNYIGTLIDIETGYKNHEKCLKERKELYSATTAIQKAYKHQNLDKIIIQNSLKLNKYNIANTIKYLQENNHIKSSDNLENKIKEISTMKSTKNNKQKQTKKKKSAEVDTKQRSLTCYFSKKRRFIHQNNHNQNTKEPQTKRMRLS